MYNTAAWRRVCALVREREGGHCQWAGCGLVDVRYGGTVRMTVHHMRKDADPFDPTYLALLCRPHHGMADGHKSNGGRGR